MITRSYTLGAEKNAPKKKGKDARGRVLVLLPHRFIVHILVGVGSGKGRARYVDFP